MTEHSDEEVARIWDILVAGGWQKPNRPSDAISKVIDYVHGIAVASPPEIRPVDRVFLPQEPLREDANGNIIPWDEEHDYFMAFDPENPDIPTD